MLNLPNGVTFADFYTAEGLSRLDSLFLETLNQKAPALAESLLAARAHPETVGKLEESTLILAVAPVLEDFLTTLFGIEKQAAALSQNHHDLMPLFEVRRLFVQRQAMKTYGKEAATFDGAALWRDLAPHFPRKTEDAELDFAHAVLIWQEEEGRGDLLDLALRYAAWATVQEKSPSVLFKEPKKLDFAHLVHTQKIHRDGVDMFVAPEGHLRPRHGFALTDAGGTLRDALSEATYCIHCHNQGRDSCSQGLKDKKTGAFQKSAFGVTLTGCPLEEKISEMHTLKIQGHALGALAVITIDNPMAAATGHRICNDCMKACIYQKQEPVNIPQAETRILRDALEQPYGFEIYSLLTRWNPLNIHRPYPKAATGKKVLVVGMGPAGFTLAHHVMNDGHTVVGIDGAKIEPLPDVLTDTTKPIEDIKALWENLDERILAGFGGVAEYGITVRWDKNFLKVVRLLLQRRAQFALFGGVRFGGTLSVAQAFDDFGFDHIALCAGAGAPTIVDIKNGLAKGVRQASDFLMALQLTGAAKADALANLQIRLPVVVIGGGLTGVDTTTEALAYYPVMVEKTLKRYDSLSEKNGEAAVRDAYRAEDLAILDEYLMHARALRAEKAKPNPDVIGLLQSWGGSTLAYRKDLTDAPSYTLNHEEVEKALEEGIAIAPNCTPVAVEVDESGWAKGLTVKHTNGGTHTLPARTILVAAGTKPNVVLHDEDPTHITLDGRYFQAIDETGSPVKPEALAKPTTPHILASRYDHHRFISFFGDMHPSFAGNVVKAMGSAKQGYPIVSRVLETEGQRQPADNAAFFAHLHDQLFATVHAVNRLTPNIVEVVVRAPQAARQFQPGQFYRLQNFETYAPIINDTRLAMEGIAATGAWVDKEQGLLATIILEMGGSSSLCQYLKIGEPIILMGPTGEPTHIPHNTTVILVGGGLGNAVLFSIGAALKAAGSRVLYFAGYKKSGDRYHVDKIESASDVVVWCCDEPSDFTPNRSQDRAYTGNIVQAIAAYARGDLGTPSIPTETVDHLVVIGSDRMMDAVRIARHGVLAPYLPNVTQAIGSINSPMQCMMKKICAQCLQIHRDPVTGQETVVYSCHNQDQPLDQVDFKCLNDRLGQNRALEILTAGWIKALPV
jgi:NADPH-dependent glutamate synthase beta subunit-like oxidoreductase/NAD(P)H-flavin reductase